MMLMYNDDVYEVLNISDGLRSQIRSCSCCCCCRCIVDVVLVMSMHNHLSEVGLMWPDMSIMTFKRSGADIA